MHCKASDIRVAPSSTHRPVHGLDDVPANGEIAQRLLEARLESPATLGNLIGKPKPFELRRSTDQEPAQFGIRVRRARTEVGDPSAVVRGCTERPIEASPAL